MVALCWGGLGDLADCAIFRHLHNVLCILHKLGNVVEMIVHSCNFAAQMVHNKVYCECTVLKTADHGWVFGDKAL